MGSAANAPSAVAAPAGPAPTTTKSQTSFTATSSANDPQCHTGCDCRRLVAESSRILREALTEKGLSFVT
ncbi:hypothetical protein GCM10009744_09750 [Kribbella alba]|uniref:Uncharacterized protein n=1 Tax=Kribbella alba TaxID=190197 RepID=A0ABN2F237_9ACTN